MKLTSYVRAASLSVQNNTYVKLLLSFVVLNILNICLVFGAYSYRSDAIMKKEIDRLSHKLLAQTQNISNYLYTSAIKGGFNLYYDESIYSAMFSGDPLDVYDQQKLVTRLNRFIQSNEIIHSIYLYNAQLDVVVSTVYPNQRVSDFPDREMTDVLRNFRYESPKIPYMLRYGMPTKPSGSPTLSLILTEPSSEDNRVQGAMVINIDDDRLRSMMVEMADDPINQLIILQDDGQFVTPTDVPAMKDGDSNRFAYYDRIAPSEKPNGTFIESIGDEKYVVSFQKTNLESTRFVYVGIYPYTKLFASLIQMRNMTLLIGACLIVLGLFLSVLLSRKLYFPIRSLTQFARKQIKGAAAEGRKDGDIETISRAFAGVIEANESLERVSSRTRLQLRDQFLRSLLLGFEESRTSFDRWVKEYQIGLIDAERIRVAVFRIDRYRTLEASYDSESFYLIRYAMRNIFDETVAGKLRSIAVDIGTDHVAALVDTSDLGGEALESALLDAQRNMRDYLKIGTTIGIGDVVETLSEATFSYQGALSATHYRIFRGEGALLAVERLFSATKSEHPQEKEKAIVDELKLGRPHRAIEAIGALLQALERQPRPDVYNVLAQSVVHLSKAIQAIPSRSGVVPAVDYRSVYDELSRLETAEQIVNRIAELLICHDESKDDAGKAKSSKSAAIVDKGIQYIDLHFDRVEFSVNDVAEHLRYSVSYLNKIFNDNIASSVHECINRKRLQRATELIEQSDIIINDIATMAGFSSSNYFYFVFKKQYGMTPNAYRKTYGKSEPG